MQLKICRLQYLEKNPQTIVQDVWDMINKKAKGVIRLYLAYSILLNIHEEKTMKYIWKKLRYVYQAKPLVNKFFL